MLNNFLKSFASGSPVAPVVPPEPPVEKLVRILKGTTNPADTFVAVSEAVETIHKSGNSGEFVSLIMAIQSLSPPGAAMRALDHIIVNTEDAALQVFITTQLNGIQGWYPNAQKWLQEIAAKQTPGPAASTMSTMFATPPATGPVTTPSATPAVMSFMGETIPIVPREQDVRFTGRSFEPPRQTQDVPLKFEWPTAKRQRDEDQEDWAQVSRQPKRATLSSMLSSSAGPSTGLQSLLSRPPQSASGLQLLPSRAAPGPAFDQAGSESSLVRRNPFASDELVTTQAIQKAARMVAGILMPELEQKMEQKMDQKIQGMGVQIMDHVDHQHNVFRTETRQEMGQFQASLLRVSQENKESLQMIMQAIQKNSGPAGAAPAPTGTAKAPAGATASKAKRAKPAPVTNADIQAFFIKAGRTLIDSDFDTFFSDEHIKKMQAETNPWVKAQEIAKKFRGPKKAACLLWLNYKTELYKTTGPTGSVTSEIETTVAEKIMSSADTLTKTGDEGDEESEEEEETSNPNPTGGAGAAAADAHTAASMLTGAIDSE